MIKENLASVRARVAAAAKRAGRDPSKIRLVCVSKTVSVERIREAYEAGERHFGENRVQELVEKAELLPADIHWHLIGHLQTNKVKAVIARTALIHSVDSVHLAEEIEKRAASAGRAAEVLVQVNTTGETSKSGVSIAGVPALLERLRALPHIGLKGWMTVGPLGAEEKNTRQAFRTLARLRDEWPVGDGKPAELSMGMTHDFEWAVEEGATILRIGTAIFGERKL